MRSQAYACTNVNIVMGLSFCVYLNYGGLYAWYPIYRSTLVYVIPIYESTHRFNFLIQSKWLRKNSLIYEMLKENALMKLWPIRIYSFSTRHTAVLAQFINVQTKWNGTKPNANLRDTA